MIQDDHCNFLFNVPSLADNVIGAILLIISLLMLTICLLLIVKVLRSALEGNFRQKFPSFKSVVFMVKKLQYMLTWISMFSRNLSKFAEEIHQCRYTICAMADRIRCHTPGGNHDFFGPIELCIYFHFNTFSWRWSDFRKLIIALIHDY